MFKGVVEFYEAIIELTPAKCKEKIVKSTAGVSWEMISAKGGYRVHPVPAPSPTNPPPQMRYRLGGSNHNLILLSRANIISGEWPIKGSNQFPNPPIITGITKKIIINACRVIIEL